MEKKIELTAVIEREGDSYVSLCPELDIASQGETIELARTNLIEALELFYETASDHELSLSVRSYSLDKGKYPLSFITL